MKSFSGMPDRGRMVVLKNEHNAVDRMYYRTYNLLLFLWNMDIKHANNFVTSFNITDFVIRMVRWDHRDEEE